MQEFDELCLPKLHVMGSKDIRQLRERLQVSQPVFAKLPEYHRLYHRAVGNRG